MIKRIGDATFALNGRSVLTMCKCYHCGRSRVETFEVTRDFIEGIRGAPQAVTSLSSDVNTAKSLKRLKIYLAIEYAPGMQRLSV